MKQETILATRQHFADLALRCIDEAESGVVKVNDLPSYVAWMRQGAVDSLAGCSDHTFTFRQYAHYLETGVCVGLLG